MVPQSKFDLLAGPVLEVCTDRSRYTTLFGRTVKY